MSKAKMIAAALVAVATVWAVGVPATLAADATVGADVNSAYVWRGLTFNDGLVVQPSVDVAHESGLGLNVWGNFDVDDYDGAVEDGEFSEIDLTASYALPIEVVDLSVGYIEYLFPGVTATDDAGVPTGAAEGTREVYVSVGKGFGDFSTGVDVYYDFDEVDDFYGKASVGYSIAVSEELSAELSAGIGYAGEDFAAYYAGGTDSGFFDWDTSLSLAYALTESVELGAFVTYTDSVDDDALPDESVDTDVYGGASVYYSF